MCVPELPGGISAVEVSSEPGARRCAPGSWCVQDVLPSAAGRPAPGKALWQLLEKESVVQPMFEIVWQASLAEAPIVLRSAADANEATIAFLEELARLRAREATGELLVRNGDGAVHPRLRQPLKDHDG